MALPRPAGRTKKNVQSLQQLSTQVVATSLDKYTSLGVLPLEVVALILNRTLTLGLLTPHSFKLFLETGHHEIREVFEKLEARETHIPVLPTRCGQR
mmetsp:Transcript_24207/g.52040  ORF Transcript_24207/g.52040 Transcript_24207/m.52040 type:complete len:97 (+) Transcript_24207:122-412(+)